MESVVTVKVGSKEDAAKLSPEQRKIINDFIDNLCDICFGYGLVWTHNTKGELKDVDVCPTCKGKNSVFDGSISPTPHLERWKKERLIAVEKK